MDNYKFTNNLSLAIEDAKEFAINLGCKYVGTEHLLYAILSREDSLAYKILSEYNVTRFKVLGLIEKQSNYKAKNIDFSPKFKDMINIAEEARKSIEASKIGSEMLLFAMLKQIDSNATTILKTLVPDFQDLFSKVSKLINDRLIEATDNMLDDSTFLGIYGKNLNDMANQNKIDEVFGREKEIDRVLQILSRRTKNNPCLVGDAGVGKTAIIEGLANKIAKGNVPTKFKDTIIYYLDISSMIAGSKYRGEFEDRLKRVLEEVSQNPNIVLFIDEIHTIIGTGSAEGSLDAANILKPVLARGDIRIIGATTNDEYRKHIEKDSALERRFQKVIIEEPSEEATRDILNKVKPIYEKYHNVSISDEVLDEIIELTSRYINDRYFPDKAIDVLDEVCSLTNNDNKTIVKLNKEQLINEALEHDDIVSALTFSKTNSKKKESKAIPVKVLSVRKIISNWSNIPLDNISNDEFSGLANLENNLKKEIIGQDKAILVICEAVKRGKTGIKDPKKPIGSFMFLGPTGCGKTQTCKALAKELFNTEDAIIRLDMSEYMEKHAVSKLIGSPPGYIGFEEGGQLTEKIRKKPYSIVLFDEIEKAHPDIYNILLQILDEGELTDSDGRKADFKNSIIIMTSNIGAKEFSKGSKLGFNSTIDDKDYKEIEKDVLSEMKKQFNPEFINRIDEIVVFNRLSKDDIKKIATLLINQTKARMSKYNIVISDNMMNQIIKDGYNAEYGARPLKRSIQKLVENPLADYIVKTRGKITNIFVDFVNEASLVKENNS